MARPSSKRRTKKATPTPAPAKVPPVQSAPEPLGEAPSADMLAVPVLPQPHEGETTAPTGDAPAEGESGGEETAPEASEADGTVEVPAEPEADKPEADVQTETAPAGPISSADPVEVRLGSVTGVLIRAPLAIVREALGPDALDRIEVLRQSATISDLQKRMRATDGRCAPVIFTAREGEVPALFDGPGSIAAAMNLGLDAIDVITIRSEDAGAAQSYLAQQASTKPTETEDDLYVRVLSHYDE